MQEVYYQDSSPTNQEFCFIKSAVLASERQGLEQKLYEVWVCIHKQKRWILTATCRVNKVSLYSTIQSLSVLISWT